MMHSFKPAVSSVTSTDEDILDSAIAMGGLGDDYFLLAEDDELDELFAIRNFEKVSSGTAEALSRFYHKANKRTKHTRHARRKEVWQ
ncbi:MAG: hypothetical protein VKK59_05040 [Vampirovibrionales bacterium]|nr:hypothetical protein [Vampirovibrionales bacterium]